MLPARRPPYDSPSRSHSRVHARASERDQVQALVADERGQALSAADPSRRRQRNARVKARPLDSENVSTSLHSFHFDYRLEESVVSIPIPSRTRLTILPQKRYQPRVKRRPQRFSRSKLDQGVNLVLSEAPAPVECLELGNKGNAYHLAPEPLDQLHLRLRRCASGEQIVVN